MSISTEGERVAAWPCYSVMMRPLRTCSPMGPVHGGRKTALRTWSEVKLETGSMSVAAFELLHPKNQ